MPRNSRLKKRLKVNKIARERVEILFKLAREKVKGTGENQALARRYIFLARKLYMRIRSPMAFHFKRQICKKCNALLIPGYNARVRLQGRKKNAHVVVTCLDCGNRVRYLYHRPRPAKKGTIQDVLDHHC
ncbi:MAG: ribonuclease P protein component 4 [Promethearchaeota archaeon]